MHNGTTRTPWKSRRKKGSGILLLMWALLLLPLAAAAEGEIYKVVDKDGNVIYTDQQPSSDAQPMDLPELSVVQTDPVAPLPGAAAKDVAGEQRKPTSRELRQRLADYRILQPQQEETFWGTGNQVTVAWGATQPVPEGMSARLYVDGQAQEAPAAGSVTLTLDRGEHQVYVELLDERNRRVLATETVTFFVKQGSALINPGS